MNIIFLDIDGVLNAHEWNPEVLCGQTHPDKVARLNRILRAKQAKARAGKGRDLTLEELDEVLPQPRRPRSRWEEGKRRWA